MPPYKFQEAAYNVLNYAMTSVRLNWYWSQVVEQSRNELPFFIQSVNHHNTTSTATTRQQSDPDGIVEIGRANNYNGIVSNSHATRQAQQRERAQRDPGIHRNHNNNGGRGGDEDSNSAELGCNHSRESQQQQQSMRKRSFAEKEEHVLQAGFESALFDEKSVCSNHSSRAEAFYDPASSNFRDCGGDDKERFTNTSSSSSSSRASFNAMTNKRPRLGLLEEEEIPEPKFTHGTVVRKHFPGEGWLDGQVTTVRWSQAQGSWNYIVVYKQQHKTEVLNEDSVSDVTIPDCRQVDPTVYEFEEFQELIWKNLRIEETEKSSAVRRANTKISNEDSETQVNAQYGRILPAATDIIFQVLRLKRSDVFLDIGHGIGNTCFQAAYTRGSEARGIEIVRDRFNISLDFVQSVKQLATKLDRECGIIRTPGKVILRHGDLTDERNHSWLATANKVFVNNFNGVFAERMVSQTTEWHLDHYIAGIFASMEEDSLMITLSELPLGPTKAAVNKWRKDNGLEESPNASFFDVVKIELGEAWQVFSWSTSCQTPAHAYVYRRLRQDPSLRTASVMCCNINCKHSKSETPIPAVSFNREGKAVVATCECKMTLKSSRRIPVVSVEEFVHGLEYRDWGL